MLVDQLQRLADRGSRSLAAVDEIGLDELRERLDACVEAVEELTNGREEYESNDPAEASGADDREAAREARAEAWETIQTAARDLAEAVESLLGVIQ